MTRLPRGVYPEPGQILRGACPEQYKILPLHFVQGQDDRGRRARNDITVEHLYFVLGERAPGGYSPDSGGVVSQPPGEDPGHVGGGDPELLVVGIPYHLIAGVPQDGGGDLRLVIELLQVVLVVCLAEDLLCGADPGV